MILYILGVRITFYSVWLSLRFSCFHKIRCDKTVFYFAFMIVICTLSAQVLLTSRLEKAFCFCALGADSRRVYVVAMKNPIVVIGFLILAGCQVVFGIWMIVLLVRQGGKKASSWTREMLTLGSRIRSVAVALV